MTIMTLLLTTASLTAVNLNTAGMKHVTFDGIPATTYRNDGAELVADVNKSASFVLLPFTDPTPGDGPTAADMAADAVRQAANTARSRQRSLFAATWSCTS